MPTSDIHARIDALNAEAWELRRTDPTGATELAESALRMSIDAAGYVPGRAWSLLTIGACAIGRGEYDLAHEHLRTALELAEESGDRACEAQVRSRLGFVHNSRCDYPEALRLFNESLEIFRELGDRQGEADTLTGRGGVELRLGLFPDSLASFRSSVDICREIGNRNGEGRGLGNVGIVYFEMGEHGEALEHHHAGLSISQESGNHVGEANQHCNIGNVYASLGSYDRAVEHYHAALRLNQATGDRLLEAAALGNLGVIHAMLGELREALAHQQSCVTINQEIGNRKGEATALAELGSIHCQLQETSKAAEYYNASLAICREIGDRAGEANALIGVASTATTPQERESALRYLESAAAIAGDIGARALLTRTTLNLGDMLATLDRTAEAVEQLELGRAEAAELGERNLEMQACELLSEQYEKLGATDRALQHLRRHLQLRSEITGEETRRTVHNLQSSWQIELARREAEIERLRTVELKEAFERLEQAHTELKAAQSQLVQSEKMASLGQLTAGIAHEINNPINFVSASLGPLLRNHHHLKQVLNDLLIMLPEDSRQAVQEEEDIEETFEESTRLIATISQGAARTAEIVAGLRSFSRLDEGGLKRVDLHEGLDAALAILSGSMSEGVTLRREYGELPPVECYPGEINQVFMNILTNAIKAIEGEGTVTVRTEATADTVVISIADDGVGMTPEIESRIFEPFFTTRDVGEGRGLGLSIAWGIVEKHGGSIAVESCPGEGSVLVVTLPVSG